MSQLVSSYYIYTVYKCTPETGFAIIRNGIGYSLLKKYDNLSAVLIDASVAAKGTIVADMVWMPDEWVLPVEWETLFELCPNDHGVWQITHSSNNVSPTEV